MTDGVSMRLLPWALNHDRERLARPADHLRTHHTTERSVSVLGHAHPQVMHAHDALHHAADVAWWLLRWLLIGWLVLVVIACPSQAQTLPNELATNHASPRRLPERIHASGTHVSGLQAGMDARDAHVHGQKQTLATDWQDTLFAAAPPAQLEPWVLSDQQVQAAIEAMQAFLLSKQDSKTGRWQGGQYDRGGYEGGSSALVTLALVESGMSSHEPALAKAIDALAAIPMDKTYTRSLRAQIGAKLPKEHERQLTEDVRWLLEQQDEGAFSYGEQNRGSGQFDHSNTHFGVLGLAAMEQRSGSGSGRAWTALVGHLLGCQNADGGWGYTPGSKSTAAMTAGCLTGLLSARWNLERSRTKPAQSLDQAIEAGFAYLEDALAKGADRKLMATGGGHGLYGLLAMERCLLWDGRVRLGGDDWFRKNAWLLLNQMRDDGSVGGSLEDTAFALIFLSRGRVSVWASKLQIPGQATDNRPNDLARLTRHLSDWREETLGWQTLSIESNPLTWLNAPVLYLSADGPVSLTEGQWQKIKRYMDFGGLLVINPESDPDGVLASLQEPLSHLCPQMQWEEANETHPLFDLVLDEAGPWKQPTMVGRVGPRDWVVVLPTDLGRHLQADQNNQPGRHARALMTNLYAWATNRGMNPPRLNHPLVEPKDPMPTRDLWVGRATLAGMPAVEWYAWTPFLARMQWVADRRVRLVSLPVTELAQLDPKQMPFVHLAGSQWVQLSDDETQALVVYAKRGGTVLVETVGGRGRFAESVSLSLASVLGQARRLPLTALTAWSNAPEAMTGQPVSAAKSSQQAGGFADGVKQAQLRDWSVGFQPYTMQHFPFDGLPRLQAHWVDGRPAIWVSHLDLSLALLGLTRYGVHGYDPPSANHLLLSMLLTAEDHTLHGDHADGGDPARPEVAGVEP